MAISIDRVYKTVQRILNVEQRGQLPSDDFNLMANLAQLDLFNQLFYDEPHFDVSQKGANSILPEKIHQMKEVFISHSIPLTYEADPFTGGLTGHYNLPEDLYMLEEVYYQPSELRTVVVVEEQDPEFVGRFDTTDVDGQFDSGQSEANAENPDNWDLHFGDLPGASYPIELTNFGLPDGYDHTTSDTDFWLQDNSNGSFSRGNAFRILTIVGNQHADGGGLIMTVENFNADNQAQLILNLADMLSIFSGNYIAEETDGLYFALDHLPVVVEKMEHKGSQYIKNSKLTQPSRIFPKYERFSSSAIDPLTGVATSLDGVGNLEIYPNRGPEAIIGQSTVICDYVRKPGYGQRRPQWVGRDVFGGTELYDPDNSTDFELHQAMEHDLIKRVLFYAGISIRQEEVAQAIYGLSQSEEQQERS